MTATPCVGNEAIYDTALFDDAPAADRTQAIHQAAALCAGCPSQCDQIVTADTGPRELVLLSRNWMPPRREGRPDPTPARLPRPVIGRHRSPAPSAGRARTKPDQRIAVWAAMAVERAAMGMPLAAIAADLCVSEDTAARLLDVGRGVVAA